MDETFEVTLDLKTGYEFQVDFQQPGVPPLVVDEPPPLGEGHGPNPSRLLATAAANCLSASLLHCLRRARVEVHGIHTTVRGALARNAQGRLRIGGLDVSITVDVAPADVGRVDRCLALYEDFCVVTASLRQGVDVQVHAGAVGS